MAGNTVIAAVPVALPRAGTRGAAVTGRGDSAVWRPIPGDVLPLRIIDAVPGAWVVEAAPGIRWRLLDLPGAQAVLSGLSSTLSANSPSPNVLRARVVTSYPSVTLQLLADPPTAATPAVPLRDEAAALRLDPAVFHRIAWRELDALALTRAWEVLLQRYGQGLLAPDHPTYLPPAVPLPPWTFPVYAWGGLSVTLAVRDDEEQSAAPRRARRHSVLRLSLVLPGLGKVEAKLRALRSGISLKLAAESQAAARALEAVLPALAALLKRAELPLVHWDVAGSLQATANWVATSAAAAGTPPPVDLLRAGAELVAALSRRWPPQPV